MYMPAKQAQKKQKYKIVIELAFGPYASENDVAQVKKNIKSKAPKVVFGPVKKTKHGHAFKGHLNFVKSVAAPAHILKQAISERTPGAKVTVVKA
jgi:hypothetical protein